VRRRNKDEIVHSAAHGDDQVIPANTARQDFAFRSLSATLIMAGLVFFVSLFTGHAEANIDGVLTIAATCLAIGVLIYLVPSRYKQLDDLPSLIGIGTILITFAEVFSHQYTGAYHVVLLWPFLAGCAFFTLRQLVSTSLLTMACSFATIMLEINTGSGLSASDGLSQGILLLATLVLVGGILRLVEFRLATSQRELERVFSSAPGGLALLGSDARFTRVNDLFCHLLGFTMKEAIGKSVTDVIHVEDDPSWERRLNWLKQGRIPEIATDQRFIRSDGEVFWARVRTSLMPDGTIFMELHELQGAGIVSSRRVMRAASDLDDLTQVASRSELIKQITSFLARSTSTETYPGVLIVDLDRFSEINESLGHERGDLVLIAVAERLSTKIEPPEVLGRLSGDRFAILFPNCLSDEDAFIKANKLMALFAEPFNSISDGLSLGVTAGLAMARTGINASSLLRDAEIALKRAKDRRRGGIALFEPTMRKSTELRLVRESELRAAVGREEFIVYYQPIVDITTGEVNALEALVRWQHPTRGIVMPGDFIPLAEELGLTALIDEIGTFVLGRATADLVRFRRASPKASKLKMCVNLSAYQLGLGQELVNDVTLLLAKAGLGRGDLELELTESMLMDDPLVPETLSQLRKVGVDVVLDDFGTGYSSLSYLSHYPVDVVKVDQSFVAELGQDARAEALVMAIVNMAAALGLRLIAEGAETVEQLSALTDMGCRYVQGYLFSRPHPAQEIVQLLDGFDIVKYLGSKVARLEATPSVQRPPSQSNAVRQGLIHKPKSAPSPSQGGDRKAADDSSTDKLSTGQYDMNEFLETSLLSEEDKNLSGDSNDDPDDTDPNDSDTKKQSMKSRFSLRHSA